MNQEQKQEELFCCDAFKKYARNFGWMSFTDDKTKVTFFVMPNMMVQGTRYRVNHCPTCGANVRTIQVPEDEFFKLPKN